jgi:hypothetical protein
VYLYTYAHIYKVIEKFLVKILELIFPIIATMFRQTFPKLKNGDEEWTAGGPRVPKRWD